MDHATAIQRQENKDENLFLYAALDFKYIYLHSRLHNKTTVIQPTAQ